MPAFSATEKKLVGVVEGCGEDAVRAAYMLCTHWRPRSIADLAHTFPGKVSAACFEALASGYELWATERAIQDAPENAPSASRKR